MKTTLQLSSGNLLEGEARNVGPLAGVFDGDAQDAAVFVHVEQRVLVQVARLGDVVGLELDVQRVGVLKVSYFHNLNDRSKNALCTVSPSGNSTLSLSLGQNYVLRELRVPFGTSTDEDQKAMINVLEKSFRGPITRAVNQEVVRLRRNGVNGESLLKALARIYDQHNLRDWVDRRSLHVTARPVPKIICSEALI